MPYIIYMTNNGTGINGLNGKNGKKVAVIGGAGATTLVSLIMYINTQVSNMKDEVIEELGDVLSKEEVIDTRLQEGLSDIKEQLSVMQIKLETQCRSK